MSDKRKDLNEEQRKATVRPDIKINEPLVEPPSGGSNVTSQETPKTGSTQPGKKTD